MPNPQWFNLYPFWSSVPAARGSDPSVTVGHSLLEELPVPRQYQPGWQICPPRLVLDPRLEGYGEIGTVREILSMA